MGARRELLLPGAETHDIADGDAFFSEDRRPSLTLLRKIFGWLPEKPTTDEVPPESSDHHPTHRGTDRGCGDE